MKIYKVRMTKVSQNVNKLRTDSVEGMSSSLPVEGESFRVVGEGLAFGCRLVTTSVVQSVEASFHNGKPFYRLKTLNSVYQVEILDSVDTSQSSN